MGQRGDRAERWAAAVSAISSLVEFLRSCLNEDARAAQAEQSERNRWAARLIEMQRTGQVTGEIHYSDFSAQFSPERVLAEIEAKRQVVRLLEDADRLTEKAVELDMENTSEQLASRQVLEQVCREFARVYSTRDDYREDW